MEISQQAGVIGYREIAVFISVYHINEAIEQVKNCLLDWTLELEENGILGEGMTFSKEESVSAQHISNYYGTVVIGDISQSQICSGDNNTNTYNSLDLLASIEEIQEALKKEKLSSDDIESVREILDDIYMKVRENKKTGVIKCTLIGLKDF